MMKSVFYLGPTGDFIDQVSPEQMKQALATGEGLLWIDIEDVSSEDGDFLSDTFRFHPLAVSDCVSKNIHAPKIDDFEEYLFIIVHGINYHTDSDVVETTELGYFLGKNYVVTTHDVPMRSVTTIVQKLKQDKRPMQRGADFLAHDIVDALVDNIMPTIDEMNEKVADIEAEVVQDPKKETLTSIMQLKRSIMALERVMAPQREIMNSLSRGDYSLITERARLYYHNIYDHLVRVEMLIQSLRDLADSVLNTYLSSLSNRMNEVMKVLSIVAAIFLPLALLAGIYGMNFVNMPELKWRYGYYVVWSFMALVVTSLVVYFKKKKWL